MKILYVSQFFRPESVAASFRATEHSRIWTRLGASVTVFTGLPNFPTGKIFKGYDNELVQVEYSDGVRLIRSKIVARPNSSTLNRLINYSSFYFYGLKNLNRNIDVIGKDYDVVLATTGTIFAGLLGKVFAKRLNVPFIIEFRDLTYKQMIATGANVSSLKVKIMKNLEFKLISNASLVVVLTPGFKRELIEEGIEEKQIIVIPNGANINPVVPCSCENAKVGYFGALGVSQKIPNVIEIFDEICNKIKVELTIIGEGAEKSSVVKSIEMAKNSTLFSFYDGMPQSELEKFYSDVNFTLVSLQNNEAFKGTIPSKIFQSLSRGIPVIYIGPEGDASNLLKKSGAGVVLTGSKQECMSELENFLTSDWQSNYSVMSENALNFIRKNYTRNKLAYDMLREIEAITNEGK